MAWQPVQKCSSSSETELDLVSLPNDARNRTALCRKAGRPASWPPRIAVSKIDGAHSGPAPLLQLKLGDKSLLTHSEPSCLLRENLHVVNDVQSYEDISSDEDDSTEASTSDDDDDDDSDESWKQQFEIISGHDVFKANTPCNVCHYGEDTASSDDPDLPVDEALRYWNTKAKMMKMHVTFLRKNLMEQEKKLRELGVSN